MTPYRVPLALRADTPELLSELMLKHNIEKGAEYKYQDIQYITEKVGKNKVRRYWIAWYYEDIETVLNEQLEKANGEHT